MQVVVSELSGFCEGVARAVKTALEIDPENTYVLGEIIHNEDVVSKIAARGIRKVESIEEVPENSTLLIRSHGVKKKAFAECEKKNIRIVDCTCPFVHRTQKIVEEASAAGKTVVIIGQERHPEVEGLVGWCSGELHIFSSADEDFSVLRDKNVVLVAQTTFSEQIFLKISEIIRKVCEKTVEIFKTICYTTIGRQREARRLSEICDAILVIGGKNSANTEKLCEIASARCKLVLRIAEPDDFKYEKINFCNRVGVIAGASTPEWQIQEVLFKMAENNAEVLEEKSVKAEEVETVPAATVETPNAEQAAPAAKSVKATNEPHTASTESGKKEPTMANILADIDSKQNEQHYRKGQILTVKVVSATDDGVYISVSGKGEILVDKSELDCEQYSREAYASKVNKGMDVMVVETAPKVKLSEKAMRKVREEEAVLKDIETGKVFEVICTGYNKGGLTAELGTYPVFVPAKEIRSGYVKELDKYVGKKLRLKLIEIRKERRKEIIASQRVIIEAEREAQEAARAAKEEAFFNSIEVGMVVEGKVERATSFGAFVSVKGFDCLAHISDLSWTGVKEVKDVLEIGKRYNFQILKIDRENKKVSIGYKQLQPQPWDLAADKYAEGDIVHGKVVRIVPFGAFVELEKGIDGLVHVSQISYEWLDNPTSVLKIGQEIDAKILAFSPEEHKITLSIKELQERPVVEYAEEPVSDEKRPRNKRGNRRNRYDYEEEADYREWNESGYEGVSIAEMLAGEDKK